MFAVHSFATHSSAAAFRPSLRRYAPRRPPPIARATWPTHSTLASVDGPPRTESPRASRRPPRTRLALSRDSFALALTPPLVTTHRPAPVGGRGALQVRAGTISTNDFKVGVNVEVDNAPWKVIEFMHVKPGKGSAFVRSKLKNYLTKSTNEKTFRAGEKLQTADVEKRTMQYTYKDGDQFVFMDMETYEETRVDDDDFSKFLMEGTTCEVLSWNGKVIGVDLPINVELEVVMTDPGVKGNTASGGDKPAEVETGAMVTVPLFIQIGEKIVVDTISGKYVKRAKE
jgi:translation elongation factor P